MEQDILFREAKSFFSAFEPRGELIKGVKLPGGVILIGEGCDYNRPKVIAAPVAKSAIILAQKRKEGDRAVHFHSQNYDEKIRMSFSDPQIKETGWANFMSSSLFMLEATGKKVPGLNVYVNSDIPDSFQAGAMEALEAGAVMTAQKFGDFNLTAPDVADICAQGEANFMHKEKNGAKYLPIVMNKKGHFMYFDAGTGKAETVPGSLGELDFLLISCGQRKKWLEEKRKGVLAEVAEAIKVINRNGGEIRTLNELTLEQFDEYRSKLSLSQKKRCAFYISENERAEAAKTALSKKDMNTFLDILNDSQKNIKTRLELVAEENELLIDMINDIEGVKAARLLNLGVDGSAMVAVTKGERKAFEAKIKKNFISRTGLALTFESLDLNNEIEELDINVSEFKK